MIRFLKKNFKWLVFIPGLLGFIGLCQSNPSPDFPDGIPLLHRAFLSLNMYFMQFPNTPGNWLVEIARWTAPLATASGLFVLISSWSERLHNLFTARRPLSTAVYGPEEARSAALHALGENGIDGGDAFVNANRYLLLGSEEENLRFCRMHRPELDDKKVYLKCHSLQVHANESPNLFLFCPEETAARIFWMRHPLYQHSAACAHRIKVVFIGFGKLGKELLSSALQKNVFAPDQRIEYHIFSPDDGFLLTHPQLDKISDPVFFHGEPWTQCTELLDQARRVIVLEQQDQLSLLQDLLMLTLRREIFVFAADSFGADVIADHDRLRLYDWQSEGARLEDVFGDELIDLAKRLNQYYFNEYNPDPNRPLDKDEAWLHRDTTPFDRYSSISAADYSEIQRGMLEVDGLLATPDRFSPELMERLSELEHIRWCNFHYLRNWRYGKTANGKKDAPNRIHPLLIPYADLPDAEKQKDRNNIQIYFSLH